MRTARWTTLAGRAVRFVVGTFRAAPDAVRPRQGVPVPFGAASVWTVGYDGAGLRRVPAQGGSAEIVTVGCCLATRAELREARDAVERGAWVNATRLPGSYCALIRSHRTVRVTGDRAGVHTVYWVHEGEDVVFSTSALVLAAYAGARPDTARLLASLALFGIDSFQGASHFTGVRRVPPGHALVLERGRAPRTEPVARVPAVSFEEGAHALAQRLPIAVERRAALGGGRVSADLSGGVDSSTVTSLAAGCGPLLAVTYTDRHLADQDDVRYARRVATVFDSLTHVEVDGSAAGVGHFDMLEDRAALPVTDSPSLSLGLLALKQAQLAPALAYGSRLHLTGRGGDNVLDTVPTVLIDLAHTGRRREAVRRITAFARARRAPVHATLRQAARTVSTTRPRALSSLATTISGRQHPSGAADARARAVELLSWCGALPSAAWLTDSGRRAVAELLTGQADQADPAALPGADHERIALEQMGEEHATYDQISHQLWGLPIHAPYLDTPVVDACLAVSGWERRPAGDFKPLARAALTSTVPRFLLNRRTKTPMDASFHTGLRSNIRTLRAVLRDSQLAAAGLIDPATAQAALESAARGEHAPVSALHYLIAAELWLATAPTRRERWWETAPAPAQEAA
ncbi:albusnodin/ikarugamycin family macrolactam cyclase [Streptomyces malaysiensis]|uniref:asparagine synthase (glutamine-hydrolyzing) n=1 Tax=Streptomyces malaysiensis subsp. samsunensis TaxID=459658 RepID=A0A9X2M7F9_STRMQ|nr:albusnodin/ikarugamycin family macrolactam cyclase [Streptomyces samsunensis]MCQ8836185.1 albusnodin/ikarugamycin family macrolactam cyclase [Streptomyces samsunensis]